MQWQTPYMGQAEGCWLVTASIPPPAMHTATSAGGIREGIENFPMEVLLGSLLTPASTR